MPFRRMAVDNCNMRPFFMRRHKENSLGLDVLRIYCRTMTQIFSSKALKSASLKTRKAAMTRLNILVGHLTFLEAQEKKAIEFGGVEPKQRTLYHSNSFSAHDFARAAFNAKVIVHEPKPMPVDRDVTNSPVVRTAFEPLQKEDTAVFKEELESISAFQLGQRIVTKRYQFNGVHDSFLHSRTIVTETPEPIREKFICEDDEDMEIVENIDDPKTWWHLDDKSDIGKSMKFGDLRGKTTDVNVSQLAAKFNERRHR